MSGRWFYVSDVLLAIAGVSQIISLMAFVASVIIKEILRAI